jgi:hypothetical protein
VKRSPNPIAGYDYGTDRVPSSPVTRESLQQLVETVGLTDEDRRYLALTDAHGTDEGGAAQRRPVESSLCKRWTLVPTWGKHSITHVFVQAEFRLIFLLREDRLFAC